MRLIFAESRGDSFHLKSTEFTEVDSRPFGEKKGKRKNIYVRAILHIFYSFYDKPVLAERSVDAARNVSVQWQ